MHCRLGKGNQPMSLLNDLKAVNPKKPNLAEWLLARTPEERQEFDKALAGGAPAHVMVRIVRDHGGSTTDRSVEEYRARVASR